MSIKESLNNTIIYDPSKFDFKEFEKILIELEEKSRLKKIKEAKRLKDSWQELSEKSKKFNEEIPDEVLVIVSINRPIGSNLYNKYKKWFE